MSIDLGKKENIIANRMLKDRVPQRGYVDSAEYIIGRRGDIICYFMFIAEVLNHPVRTFQVIRRAQQAMKACVHLNETRALFRAGQSLARQESLQDFLNKNRV